MIAPTFTVSPSADAAARPSMPATGEGTSTATLSVSRLAIGSSACDGFAGLLQPLAQRRLGDRLAQRRDLHVGRHVLRSLDGQSLRARRLMAERLGDRAPPVRAGGAWRGRSPVAALGGAAGIARRACAPASAAARHSSSSALDEEPGAGILRLFLRPDHLFQVGHALASRSTSGSAGKG